MAKLIKQQVIYEESSKSYIVFAFTGITIFMIVINIIIFGLSIKPIICLALCLLLFLLSHTVFISVETDLIEVSYGIGIISKKIPYTQLESFHIASNDSLFTRIYRPMQPLVIELNNTNGKNIKAPTKDPNTLSTILGKLAVVSTN